MSKEMTKRKWITYHIRKIRILHIFFEVHKYAIALIFSKMFFDKILIISVEQKLRFGQVLGWLAILKKKFGPSMSNFIGYIFFSWAKKV